MRMWSPFHRVPSGTRPQDNRALGFDTIGRTDKALDLATLAMRAAGTNNEHHPVAPVSSPPMWATGARAGLDCLSQKKPGATGKPGFSQQTSADSLDLPPVIQPAIGSGRSNRGTFLCHLQLFRMTIQQDPYEND